MNRSVVILVNHLSGAGHLSRALALGRAFGAAGWAAHIISGGLPVPQFDTAGVTLHQLPPIRVEGTDFSRHFTADGERVDARYTAARIEAAEAALDRIRPDLLIVELYPFGRRALRAEYDAILATARALPGLRCIVSSVRDILAPPSSARKVAMAEEVLLRDMDGVLVHSDPQAIRLDASWPVTEAMRPLLHYTGFVTEPLPPRSCTTGQGEILVSVGSGTFGARLLDVAIEAARGDDKTWRILVPGNDATRLAQLRMAAATTTRVEPVRSDFRVLLQNARASISLGGYNTSMDILLTGIPAVIVPYDGDNETEQARRATALAALPGVERLAWDDLAPDSLRAALRRALGAEPRRPSEVSFDGARISVEICARLLDA